MAARTLPTMPSWSTGQEITSSLLNQITAYSQFWSSPPMFSMYQATVQSVATGAYAQITCDTSLWDTDSGRSATTPYSYTIPFAGRWEFSWKIGWAVNATGGRLSALYQNGTIVTGSQTGLQAITDAGRTTDVAASTKTVLCNVGDVMSIWAFQDSGGNLSTDTTGGASYFEGRLVSLASP
jgi:hypothetical protein